MSAVELEGAVFRVPGGLRAVLAMRLVDGDGRDAVSASTRLRLAADLLDPEYTGPESGVTVPDGYTPFVLETELFKRLMAAGREGANIADLIAGLLDERDAMRSAESVATVKGDMPRRLRDLIGDLTTKDGSAGRICYASTRFGDYDREFLAGIEAAFESAGLLDVPVSPEGRTVDREVLVAAGWSAFATTPGGAFDSVRAAVDAVLAELGIEVPA